MSYPVLHVPAGGVVPIMFSSFDSNGASITLTGLAVTDIEIYKDGSVTQRASDAGYVLLDTDGIDFDGLTGIHGFSIDTGDNTDAGFYTVGAWFTVVVSAVTIDTRTVRFIAAMFRLMRAEGVAGVPKADVHSITGVAVSTTTAQLGVNVVQVSTDATAADNLEAILDGTGGVTLVASAFTLTTPITANATQLSGDATAADNAEAFFDGTGYAGTNNVIPSVTTVTGNVNGSVASVTGAVGSVTGAVGSIGAGGIATTSFAAGAIDAAAIAANAIGASELAADAATEIADAILTRQMTEAYAADGAAPTLAQALFGILQGLTEFAISGTTLTVKKLDGSTTAMVFTLDSATTPTSRTRAS